MRSKAAFSRQMARFSFEIAASGVEFVYSEDARESRTKCSFLKETPILQAF
jgi:hypothetical protein